MVGPDFWKLGLAEWKRCRDDKVKAVDHHWLHPTFALYVYEVLQHP